MNKKILALVLTAAISFSSVITAFAAETATNISLDDRARFTVTLQSNSLVFDNEPTDKDYDSISLEVCDISGTVFSKVTYDRGQGGGATIDVAGIPDGSYGVRVGYVTKGFKQYRDRYSYTLEVKSGVGSFKGISHYDNNLKAIANERTDAYALSFYKGSPQAAYIKQANIITAGITDDYAKVKAIHDWVANNMYYDYTDLTAAYVDKAARDELFPGAGVPKVGICVNYAGATLDLMRGAGFPAKTVGGTVELGDHDWNEVYVDGRWVFLDTTHDSKNSVINGVLSKQVKCTQTYFDTPVVEWSATHRLSRDVITQDADAWNGSLYIVDSLGMGKVLQEVKNFPLGGLLTSNYGYDALYSDGGCTIPWNYATDRIDGQRAKVYVKADGRTVTYDAKSDTVTTHDGLTIPFDSQGGTAVPSVVVNLGADGFSKVPKPTTTPTKDGYTFVGWVVGNPHNSKLWDFNTMVVSYNNTLYAKWTKN